LILGNQQQASTSMAASSHILAKDPTPQFLPFLAYPLRPQSLRSFSDSDFFSEDYALMHTQSLTTALLLVESSYE